MAICRDNQHSGVANIVLARLPLSGYIEESGLTLLIAGQEADHWGVVLEASLKEGEEWIRRSLNLSGLS